MTVTTPYDPRPSRTTPTQPGLGPLVWQRTDTVGTEVVFQDRAARPTATGTAVVGGALPHVTHWHADLDPDRAIRALTVTCEGAGWRRELTLSRADGDSAWTCRADATGELDATAPGIDDPGRLNGVVVVRLADSPIFVSWAVRRLRLAPGGGLPVPSARVLAPSLTVVPGLGTYQLVSEHRLRIAGEEPGATYDLDAAGMVTYQPGRFRLAH